VMEAKDGPNVPSFLRSSRSGFDTRERLGGR
jgi:hypothetical protein